MTYIDEGPNPENGREPSPDDIVPPSKDTPSPSGDSLSPSGGASVTDSTAGPEQPTIVQAAVAAESEEPTLEEPKFIAASDQPTVVRPQPAVVPAPSEPQPLQRTDMVPKVTLESSSNGETPNTEDVATPFAALVPPPQEDDANKDDTSDFTMSDVTFSDITLSDVGGGRVLPWLRGLKPHQNTVRSVLHLHQLGEDKPVEVRAKRAPWGLSRLQFGLIVGCVALVLLVAFFAIFDNGLYYDKIHPGVKVAGQSLSGMDREEATSALASYVGEARNQPITLIGGGKSWEVLPADLDISIDVQAAVSAAMAVTRGSNSLSDFGKKIKLYFDDEDLPLQGTVNNAKMDRLLEQIARSLDKPASNARLLIVEDNVEVAEGEDGLIVDKDTLRTQLTDLLFTFHSTELPIPMMVEKPDVAAVDITPALAKANVMISADLELSHEGKALATFTPREIASYMDIVYEQVGDTTTSVPVLSPDKMAVFFDGIESVVAIPGKNATMNSDGETVWVVPGEDGEGLDREATAAALTDAAHGIDHRSAAVVMTAAPPDLTTEEVEAMGIKDLLAAYATTPYSGSAGRQQNVRLATSKCSGVLLAPGEEFNTDNRLGPRDAAHGWATAPGIVGFGEMEDVYGGGICQVSTTLFNAVLEAGLEITERWNHSIYINHYPKGRDATVTAGGKNMRFRNDTAHYIFVYGESNGISTKFYIWGVSDGRSVKIDVGDFYDVQPHTATTVYNPLLPAGASVEIFSGQNGRRCLMTRVVTYADGTTHEDKFKSNFPTMPSVTEVGPTVTTTTTGTTSTSSSTSSTSSTTSSTTEAAEQ